MQGYLPAVGRERRSGRECPFVCAGRSAEPDAVGNRYAPPQGGVGQQRFEERHIPEIAFEPCGSLHAAGVEHVSRRPVRRECDVSLKFYFGLYDSGKYWDTGDLSWEIEDNKYVIDEVWDEYGEKYKSFGGWYISGEISRKTKGAIDAFRTMGKQCKDVSGGLPTFISPWIDGKKAVMGTGKLTKEDAVSVQEHEREWNEIFDGVHDVVDACAFQDGHIDYDELDAFFAVNKKLADKYGMQCWTNAETFDRDMPIDFLPIKFDKLRMKLEAAKRAGYDKAITFEFSHFMSPQSAYLQAGHLYNRYKEYFNIR